MAAQAGIAPMGVYNRFGGKDGLIDALLIIGFDRLRASIAGGDEPDLLERLRACGMRYRRFALENRHFYAIMFEAALVEQSSSPEVAEHAAAAFDALVDNVAITAAARPDRGRAAARGRPADLERRARRGGPGAQGASADARPGGHLRRRRGHDAARPGRLAAWLAARRQIPR